MAGLFVPALLHAQSSDPTQQPAFRIEANFVRVDVYPSRNGRPTLDLRAEDFELFEDGRPQRIETFEHVRVRPGGAQADRIEPNSQREANALAADPRNRVFVLFLDTYHVERGSSRNVRDALVRTLDRIIGPDDLVGVMTPEMSATDLALGRRTTTIEGMLSRHWWGRRDEIAFRDPEEDAYELCYPPHRGDSGISPIAHEMIQRRREKRSLDAMADLVIHLRGLREERKAILAISEGWRLFSPNPGLLGAKPVALPGVFVTPEGKIDTTDRRRGEDLSQSQCDADRMNLAMLDNDRRFRELLDDANRANASFYPIDPRGLPVFDTPVGPGPLLSPTADANQLRRRQQALRTLADATDGLDVMGSNDLDSSLERIVGDLTSYYLLGYYSDASKLDGKFRSIKVRVKQPGVSVRARRGYRAATMEELRAASAATGSAATSTGNAAIPKALAVLAGIRSDARLRLHVASAARSSQEPGAGPSVLWLVGEFGTDATQWKTGGSASVFVTTADGTTVASGRVAVAPASERFVAELEAGTLPPGDYVAQVRVAPVEGDPIREAIQFSVSETTGGLGRPLVFRQGPSRGQPFEPTADMRFRRNERLRLEAAISSGGVTLAARLYDASGSSMSIPFGTSERSDPNTGMRWCVAELALAPLAPGDYVIGLSANGDTQNVVLQAFRVVP